MASAPNEERPRFTTFEPWNHQPGLWVVTVLSVVYAAITLVVRHLIRRKFTRTDATLTAAYSLGACSYALMFAALEQGVGKSPERLSFSAYETASKLTYASLIFLLLACGTAACAQICQLEEIMPGRHDKRVCWVGLIICACCTIISPIIVSAGCSSAETLESSPAQCQPVPRWSGAIAMVVITLLLPALLPFYLFRKLHTKANRKVGIYAAFAFPLVNIPVAAVALHLYIQFADDGQPGTDIVRFLCALEVLLGWALICVTIPIGRPMALRFHTNGALILSEYGSNFTSGRHARTISPPPSKPRPSLPHDNEFNIDRFMNSSSARRDSTAPINNSQDQEQGIRKTVMMEIENEDAIHFIMRQSG